MGKVCIIIISWIGGVPERQGEGEKEKGPGWGDSWRRIWHLHWQRTNCEGDVKKKRNNSLISYNQIEKCQSWKFCKTFQSYYPVRRPVDRLRCPGPRRPHQCLPREPSQSYALFTLSCLSSIYNLAIWERLWFSFDKGAKLDQFVCILAGWRYQGSAISVCGRAAPTIPSVHHHTNNARVFFQNPSFWLVSPCLFRLLIGCLIL